MFAVIPPGGSRRAAKNINVNATCCPMPPGILTNNHQYVLSECPEGFVATGAKQEIIRSDDSVRPQDRDKPNYWFNGRLQYLRCTEIDTTKYKLGPVIAGTRIGYESSFRSVFEKTTSRGKIPLALRFGLGRSGRGRWMEITCAAIPWGSVLTSKKSKYCSGFFFRQILDIENDDRAVALFPDCLAIEKPHSVGAKCVKRQD